MTKWHVKLIEHVPVFIGWFGWSLLFVLSLWGVVGEYLLGSLFFVYMLFAVCDDFRKFGTKRLLGRGPLGRRYYIFQIATLAISALINMTVYWNLFVSYHVHNVE